MALHGYVSDLEEGDVLEPVEYVMTPFVIREYCHGVDEDWERFHAPGSDGEPQVASPTLAHIEKIRLFKHNCPKGPGPSARIHLRYHARHHAPIPAGAALITSGYVSGRTVKRGRERIDIDLEVRDRSTGELYTSYRDTAILDFRPKEDA